MRNICILILLLLFITPMCGQLVQFTYYHYSDSKNWKDAQDFCRKNHNDLLTIRDDQENQNTYQGGWIGLYRETPSSPWKWSSGDEFGEYINWESGQPASGLNCVFKHGAPWRTDDCTTATHTYSCYDVLILVKENKTWDEALDYCRSLGGVDTASSYWNHRYDLATLITPEIQATALNSTQAATTDEVWTGMRFLAGKWLWVGGEQMPYENFPSCPTNGSCGVIEKNSFASFSTRDCQLQRNFFCYKRPQTL